MSASAHASGIVEWLDGAVVDASRVGGKGASLNGLIRAGFRVPAGFCLTTDAFETQVAGLPAASAARSDPATLADGSTRAALVEALLAGPLAGPIRDSLGPALARLAGSPPDGAGAPARLAVRSSAVGEDGADASYAGLHDTELGIAVDDVGPAVLRCWSSLWSDRAVAYRGRRGLSLDGGAMAIVIQELVPARAAAVAFTRHPVTGREDHVVINAAPGLGEAMVSGTVTPDTIVVDKSDRAVLEFTPGETGQGPALGDDARDELVRLCLEVERAFGTPVDIEAALDVDGWYLLQARPITTR
jgi:phosphoenolpyruvate synthase/pyruvate phosphate dikinase